MKTQGTAADLSEDNRRAAFKELVETQDTGAGVREARAFVANRYGITAEAVVALEREGIDGQWPPF